jgi:hypothetical protein
MPPEPSELMEQHNPPPPTPKAASLLRDDVEAVRQKIALASTALSEASRAIQGLSARYGSFTEEERARYGIGFLPNAGAVKEAGRDVEHRLQEGD